MMLIGISQNKKAIFANQRNNQKNKKI